MHVFTTPCQGSKSESHESFYKGWIKSRMITRIDVGIKDEKSEILDKFNFVIDSY